MRKILVLLASVLLIASCLFSICSCSFAAAGSAEADIVLGASPDESELIPDEGEDDVEFLSTAAEAGIFDNIPVVDTPDPTPATPGLRFKLIDFGKDDNGERKLAYSVVGYNKFHLEGGANLSKDVYIPYTYDGAPVIAISPRAFEDTSITKVTLPKTLLVIGDKAFQKSTVQELTVPASVLDIARNAFADCNSLSAFAVAPGNARYSMTGNFLMDGNVLVRGFGNGVIPSYVTEIGEYAFRGCNALTELTVPATITKIGISAFSNCPNLVSANIETQLTATPNNLFDGCKSLVAVTLPESVTEYGYACFRDTGFTEFTVPANIVVVGTEAFAACANLVAIELGAGIKTIGGSAFKNCTKLEALVMPKGLETVGGNLCSGCSKLSKVWIAPTVTSIGSGAFNGCFRLSELFIPQSVTRLGGMILYGVEKTTAIKIETSYVPINWVSSYNVYLIENALESGKIPTVIQYLPVKKEQSVPQDYAEYYEYTGLVAAQ